MHHAPTIRRGSIVAGCLACWLVLLTAARAAEPGQVDYNRDVRPILSNNCFACHGPDEAQRQGGLRLDVAEAALKPAESGETPIVPGKPAASAVVARIFAEDDGERMPPSESNKTLTPDQKNLLKRWIAEGAKVETHWSLVPPLQPALPSVRNGDWGANEIDRFVLARLEREGLTPSAPAERLALVRRVYLDLIGLLPTPDEADAFARDGRPTAYAELVDRLLDSPHYGERWARRWLDLARYADTNGYEKDRARSIWPYRDWVIKALNADMPFDRFTIAQIAGDLLPDGGLDARVATGFHRNTMTNEEGGIDVEEFRYYSIVDRANTTSAVWLGLTVGCAQCHNHKFDPITQRDYFQLLALLNNADEPELTVPDVAIESQRREVDAKVAALEQERDAHFDAAKFSAWLAEQAKSAQPWTTLAPASAISTGNATMNVLTDRSVLVTGDKPNQDTYVVELTIDQPRITALRLEVLPHESLPDGGPGRAPLYSVGDFMLGEVQAEVVAADGSTCPLRFKDATHSFASEKMSAAQAVDGDLDTGWSIKGRTGEAHQAVFSCETPLDVEAGSRVRLTLAQRYIHQMTIGRFRLAVSSDTAPRASALPAEVEAALLTPVEARAEQESQRIKSYYLATAAELGEWNKKIVELRNSAPKHPTTLVMQERLTAQRRTTHLRHRGEFLNPRDSVSPGVPALLHALPADAPADRLALARWLVDARNPLVARVTMNRHWQYFFGRGLVRTSEDFGVRGEPPSHPELLDYLATEFVRRGWSLKQMHRLIVTSATYQQSSQAARESHKRDPENVVLARGPRVRVEAETVRDMALAASGLLNDKVGGPSVFPPQPAGAADLGYSDKDWPTSQGRDRFRRGLYTYLKRTSPFAAFTTFDAPSGENCVVRRERSNTPLQALTLLNDAAFVEAAQALARRVLAAAPSDEARARVALRLCLTREPGREELDELLSFCASQRSRLEKDTASAQAIAGDAADSTASDVVERAAWTLTARAILNTDEFITKQ